MKKFFNKVLKKCVTLALCLTIPCTLFLTACGGGNNDNNNNNPHTHDYKTTWSTSATHHWHDCKGEDCTEKSSYAEHSYTNYVCVCGHEDPNKPTDPSNPTNPTANKYADVVAKIEAQMFSVMEIELDVMLIDIDPADGHLVWWANEGTKLVKYKLTTELIGTTNAEIIQTLEESTRGTRYTLIHTYVSDNTLENNATLVNGLTQTLVGEGYTILVGGVSNTYGNNVDSTLGDISMFDVDLLLEKDGTIYEYNDAIIASRDWQDKTPYEAVTEGVKDVTYETQSEVKTLGNLAKDYQEEVEASQSATPTATAASVTTYGVYVTNE